MMKRKGLTLGVVQDMELMKTAGIEFWIRIYAKFFSLPNESVKIMSEYFKIWDQLRQCCGLQMSKNYRNEMLPAEDRDMEMNPHKFCGSIDLDALEWSFIKTELYQLIDQYETMRRVNCPATVDDDLDGT